MTWERVTIAQTLNVESRNWIVLVPRSSPSKKLMNMKGQVGLKSLLKFGVVDGQIVQVVGQVSKMLKMWSIGLFTSLLTPTCD